MLHEILTIQCIRDTPRVPCRTVTTKTTEGTPSTSLKSKFVWHAILTSLGNYNFRKAHEKLEFWHFMNILNGRLVRTIHIDIILLFVFLAPFIAVKTAVAVLFRREFV